MRQLYITFKFDIKDGTENGFYHDLADYMIDEAWDAICGNGLEPAPYPCYEFKEVEVDSITS